MTLILEIEEARNKMLQAVKVGDLWLANWYHKDLDFYVQLKTDSERRSIERLRKYAELAEASELKAQLILDRIIYG